MRLISLTANMPSFRSVNFNPEGLSLIVAKRRKPQDADSSKTYNGVGKSLLLDLVHFCLGASKNDVYERKLPGWEFTLRFEVKGVAYVAQRRTSDQDTIVLDGEEIKVAKFCAQLEKEVFPFAEGVAYLTFRSLLTRFMRPAKESYTSFDTTYVKEKPYQRLINNAYLLGLETSLITEKHRLREEQERIRKLRDNLDKDSVFQMFFTSGKNVDIDLKDLEDKSKQLEADLQAFRVAENYHEIHSEADALSKSIRELENRQFMLSSAIENIEKSMRLQPDIAPDLVAALYREAQVALPEAVLKTLDEVRQFHEQLLTNRIKRLSAEKTALEGELSSIDQELGAKGRDLDDKMKFLGSHGALEEFVAITNKLSDLRSKAQKIRAYKGLLEEYSNELQRLQVALANENLKTHTYLKDSETLLNSNLERFRSFSRRFYHDKPGGLIVKANDGENQLRFEIDAAIEDDSSDGINEVKIFCFDQTILTGRHNHFIRLLFHDSRLFGDIDPRQRATLFKVASETARELRDQYIATINQDQIEGMRSRFSPEEFDAIFNSKTIVLELTDQLPEEKLLGIQVDLR